MGSYVDEIVTGNEKVLYVGHVSLLAFMPSFLVAAVLVLFALGAVVSQQAWSGLAAVAAFALALVVVAAALIKRKSTELAVTNRRVIAKFGLISRRTIELNLSKLESIRVDQTIAGRILGYGSIVLAGTGATLEPIPFIASPIAFRQAVQSASDDVQAR
jgi:uncharacterized membrane protein YdbT with pleckstrin-like domain